MNSIMGERNILPCNTGVPHYLKVDRSYETFGKPKLYKAKKQLIYTEIFFSAFLDRGKKPLFVFSDTLGHIWLVDAQNKWR